MPNPTPDSTSLEHIPATYRPAVAKYLRQLAADPRPLTNLQLMGAVQAWARRRLGQAAHETLYRLAWHALPANAPKPRRPGVRVHLGETAYPVACGPAEAESVRGVTGSLTLLESHPDFLQKKQAGDRGMATPGFDV